MNNINETDVRNTLYCSVLPFHYTLILERLYHERKIKQAEVNGNNLIDSRRWARIASFYMHLLRQYFQIQSASRSYTKQYQRAGQFILTEKATIYRV